MSTTVDNSHDPKTGRIFDSFTVFGAWPDRPANISPETLTATLTRHRVARALTVCAEGIVGDCAGGNDHAWALAKQDQRLLPVPALNPAQHPYCCREIERMAAAGARLFATFPETQEWQPDSWGFRLLLQELAQVPAGLLVEATRAETVTGLVRAAAGTDLPLVLLGVNHRNLGETLAAASFHPRLYVDTHLLAPVGGVEQCCETLGGERVLFGSGAPLCYFSSAFLRTRFAALRPEQIAALLHDNAAALVEALGCPS